MNEGPFSGAGPLLLISSLSGRTQREANVGDWNASLSRVSHMTFVFREHWYPTQLFFARLTVSHAEYPSPNRTTNTHSHESSAGWPSRRSFPAFCGALHPAQQHKWAANRSVLGKQNKPVVRASNLLKVASTCAVPDDAVFVPLPQNKKTKKTVLQPDIRPEKSNVVGVRLSLVLIFKCGVGVFLASRGIRWQNFSLAEHFQKKKKCSSRKLDGNPMRVKI